MHQEVLYLLPSHNKIIASPPPIVGTQTQDSIDDHSGGLPKDGDLSIDPHVGAALRARHLQITNEFLEATQSICSKLVHVLLCPKMKVKKRVPGDTCTVEIE